MKRTACGYQNKGSHDVTELRKFIKALPDSNLVRKLMAEVNQEKKFLTKFTKLECYELLYKYVDLTADEKVQSFLANRYPVKVEQPELSSSPVSAAFRANLKVLPGILTHKQLFQEIGKVIEKDKIVECNERAMLTLSSFVREFKVAIPCDVAWPNEEQGSGNFVIVENLQFKGILRSKPNGYYLTGLPGYTLKEVTKIFPFLGSQHSPKFLILKPSFLEYYNNALQQWAN